MTADPIQSDQCHAILMHPTWAIAQNAIPIYAKGPGTQTEGMYPKPQLRDLILKPYRHTLYWGTLGDSIKYGKYGSTIHKLDCGSHGPQASSSRICLGFRVLPLELYSWVVGFPGAAFKEAFKGIEGHLKSVWGLC